MSPKAFRRMAIALIGNGLIRVGGGAGGVLVGFYFAELVHRGRSVEAGLVGALSAVSYGAELLGAIPFGIATDALTPRLVMVGGSLLAALAAELVALDQHVQIFFLARALEGIAAAAQAPSILAYLTDATQNSGQRGRILSFFELSLLASIALGGPVGAALWRAFDIRAFTGVATIYVASAFCFLIGMIGPKRVSGKVVEGLFSVLRKPAVRNLAPAWLCMNAIVGLWLGPVLTFLLTRPAGSDQYLDGIFSDRPGHVGWLMFSYAVVFGAGVTMWSFRIDRMSRKRVLAVGLGAMLAVCVGLYVVNHSQSFTAVGRWMLIGATAAAVMVESGFTPAALALLGDAVGDRMGRGSAMGIYSALLGTGALVGSLIAGAMASRFAMDGLIFATAGLAIVAALALTRLRDIEPAS